VSMREHASLQSLQSLKRFQKVSKSRNSWIRWNSGNANREANRGTGLNPAPKWTLRHDRQQQFDLFSNIRRVMGRSGGGYARQWICFSTTWFQKVFKM